MFIFIPGSEIRVNLEPDSAKVANTSSLLCIYSELNRRLRVFLLSSSRLTFKEGKSMSWYFMFLDVLSVSG